MRGRLLALTIVAAALLTGCGSTNRPEGIVERWLLALNDGKAGRPELYAPHSLSQRILPGWRTKDPGRLDTIEVGRGSEFDVVGLAPNPQYAVPYRVVRLNGSTLRGVVILQSREHQWQIAFVGPVANWHLPLPSEGGPPIASMSFKTWLVALAVAVALALISVGLMTLVGRRPEQLAAFPAEGKT